MDVDIIARNIIAYTYQFEYKPLIAIFSFGQFDESYLHLFPLQPILHAISAGIILRTLCVNRL